MTKRNFLGTGFLYLISKLTSLLIICPRVYERDTGLRTLVNFKEGFQNRKALSNIWTIFFLQGWLSLLFVVVDESSNSSGITFFFLFYGLAMGSRGRHVSWSQTERNWRIGGAALSPKFPIEQEPKVTETPPLHF